jgi:transcriptional regulator with XRE-family HTH domain
MYLKSLGNLIKELREKFDWSQRKLAQELDIDVAVLSRIENENKFPKKRVPEIIKVISSLFHVDSTELHKMYLSDEISLLLITEENYQEVLKVSEQKVNYERSKSIVQSEIKYQDGNSN